MERPHVLLTGAGRGIGRAIALRFAREGAVVALAARSLDELEQVAQESREQGGEALVCVMDVSDPTSVRSGTEGVLARLDGRLDVLVNNAGIFDIVPFEDTSPEMWQRFMDVNLRSAYLVTRHALSGLEQSPQAHVFNIASVAARQGYAGSSIYCATKAGMMGFSNGLREDLRPQGIRVSTVYPGATDTSIFDDLPGEWDRAAMNQPEDVADQIWRAFTGEVAADDVEIPAPGSLL